MTNFILINKEKTRATIRHSKRSALALQEPLSEFLYSLPVYEREREREKEAQVISVMKLTSLEPPASSFNDTAAESRTHEDELVLDRVKINLSVYKYSFYWKPLKLGSTSCIAKHNNELIIILLFL